MSGPPVEVDTVRLRGRLRDGDAFASMGSATVRRVTDAATGEVRTETVAGFDTLPSGARVGVDRLHGGAAEAWVEFSAPKIATGSNVLALPVRQAVEVGREVYAEAASVVSWLDPYEHARVLRLDLDRDFSDVDHQEALLAGLSKVRAAYNPKTRLFPDPAHAGAVTLTRGPASRWQSTLYSKEGEARHRLRYAPEDRREQLARDVEAARGRLRYESRLRSDVLGPAGLHLVGDLADEERLEGLRRKYFDRVGYGLEVAGMSRAVAVVMGSDLGETAKLRLLGLLTAEAQGMPVALSRTSVWRYRKDCEALGLTAADMSALATTSIRLDYEQGRAVAA